MELAYNKSNLHEGHTESEPEHLLNLLSSDVGIQLYFSLFWSEPDLIRHKLT